MPACSSALPRGADRGQADLPEAAHQSWKHAHGGAGDQAAESELRELRLAAPSFAAAFLQQACASSSRHIRGSACGWTSTKPSSSQRGGYDLGLRDGPIDLPGLVARPLAFEPDVLRQPAYLARQPAPQDGGLSAWLVFSTLHEPELLVDGLAPASVDQPRPQWPATTTTSAHTCWPGWACSSAYSGRSRRCS